MRGKTQDHVSMGGGAKTPQSPQNKTDRLNYASRRLRQIKSRRAYRAAPRPYSSCATYVGSGSFSKIAFVMRVCSDGMSTAGQNDHEGETKFMPFRRFNILRGEIVAQTASETTGAGLRAQGRDCAFGALQTL